MAESVQVGHGVVRARARLRVVHLHEALPGQRTGRRHVEEGHRRAQHRAQALLVQQLRDLRANKFTLILKFYIHLQEIVI